MAPGKPPAWAVSWETNWESTGAVVTGTTVALIPGRRLTQLIATASMLTPNPSEAVRAAWRIASVRWPASAWASALTSAAVLAVPGVAVVSAGASESNP